MEIDANVLIQKLMDRISNLEFENAKLQAALEQVAALEGTEDRRPKLVEAEPVG